MAGDDAKIERVKKERKGERMRRIIRLPLVQPLCSKLADEKDATHADSAPVVEVDTCEGTVKLPDGTIVLAESWICVAEKIKNMKKRGDPIDRWRNWTLSELDDCEGKARECR